MATVSKMTPSSPSGSGKRIGLISRVSVNLDVKAIKKDSASLLVDGLNEYQQLLNQKLITSLSTDFERWLDDTQKRIKTQLQSLPKHAKAQWLEDRLRGYDRRVPENQALRLLTDFLFQFAHRQLNDLRRLKKQNEKFRKTMSAVFSDADRKHAILAYAKQLGASVSQLRGDERAFGRWFDEEAVNDRYEKLRGETELLLCFTFDRIGHLMQRVVRVVKTIFEGELENERPKPAEFLHKRLAELWRRLGIESRISEAMRYPGDARVRAAALKSLRMASSELPDELGEEILDRPTLLSLYRIASEGTEDVWVQCESLSIIAYLSRRQSSKVLESRIQRPRSGDDFFVRQHVYKVIGEQLARSGPMDVKLPAVESEPSDLVRQQMANLALHWDKFRDHWTSLLKDPVPQVRGAAVLAFLSKDGSIPDKIECLESILKAARSETEPFVLRVAMFVFRKALDAVEDPSEQVLLHAFYEKRITPFVRRLQTEHGETPVRRWAAQTSDCIWAACDAEISELIQRLRPVLSRIKPGSTKRFSKSWFKKFDDEKLGRIFAVLAQDDFGYDIHRGWRGVFVTRGPVFGFRLWRFLHEFRNTATDKRQALSHTVGRINSATMRAPSQILGELSETKIPGEPLTIGDDGGWRPFIPLMDDFVSVLNLSWLEAQTVDLYTSQGVTSIKGPDSFSKRIKAAFVLNHRFAKLATLRNWNNDTFPANSFIEEMRKLGFEVNFREHHVANNETESDETATQFFTTSCVLPVALGGTFVQSARESFLDFSDYFSSSAENTMAHLVIFVLAILVLVLLKHLFSNWTFRRARRKISISIGGWGTRGKSGTERLKAAFIGATGHGLVSKTTGCEAMFIHSNAFGEPLEIPLFRPYDKATIWEQRDLIVNASKMNPSVFLWECMALTPAFVDVLQRQWTCDDMGTITNTYPDHEDLQGPAGHNVATTISGFVPQKSHLLSTEEVMRPYVTESCRRAKTSFRGVGWLESGLVTDDVLERFPYKEHPDNVALVAAMGDELGYSHEFSFKAMGDYLVPDLGVLKTHPKSIVRTRTIEFTNGMSANERFGCMGNWKRLGFDVQDPHTDPTTWICGVVNNRADRVPRSKVFAKIIVEDMNADQFVLIGNNLKGLRGFVEEAWQEQAKNLTLTDQGQPWQTEYALQVFDQAAWDFRQPVSEDIVKAKLRCMVEAALGTTDSANNDRTDSIMNSWADPQKVTGDLKAAGVSQPYIDDIAKHLERLNTALGEYTSMRQRIKDAQDSQVDTIQSEYTQLLKTWYFRKIITVENYDANGEEVVGRIVDATPPGFTNRVIGLQNIKGTGLDFVYRFQAWDTCFEACRAVESDDTETIARGLQALIAMPAIGQLCLSRVQQVTSKAQSRKETKRPQLKTLLDQLDAKLAEAGSGEVVAQHESVAETAGAQSSTSERLADWNQWIVGAAEEFLDVNDSLLRRKTADAVYRDMAAGRISRQRAVGELRKVNKRQKGGWLTSWLSQKR